MVINFKSLYKYFFIFILFISIISSNYLYALNKGEEPLNKTFIRLKKMFVDHLLLVDVSKISNNKYASNEEIKSLLKVSKNNLPLVWELNPLDSLKKHPWIKNVEISWKIFPLRIELKIKEFKPWVLAEFSNNITWLVSDEGTLIIPLTSIEDKELIMQVANLPTLRGLEVKKDSLTSLKSESARLNYAIRTLKLLKKAGGIPFKIDRFTLLPQGALVIEPLDLLNKPRILVSFNSPKEAALCVKKLNVVLKDIKNRGEKLKEIDLRFKSQAIVKTW